MAEMKDIVCRVKLEREWVDKIIRLKWGEKLVLVADTDSKAEVDEAAKVLGGGRLAIVPKGFIDSAIIVERAEGLIERPRRKGRR
jgi:hypothetical protein